MKKSRNRKNNDSPSKRSEDDGVLAVLSRYLSDQGLNRVYLYAFFLVFISVLYIVIFGFTLTSVNSLSDFLPSGATTAVGQNRFNSIFDVMASLIGGIQPALLAAIFAMAIFMFAELYRYFITRGKTSDIYWSIVLVGWIFFLPMALHFAILGILLFSIVIFPAVVLLVLRIFVHYLTGGEVLLFESFGSLMKKLMPKREPKKSKSKLP